MNKFRALARLFRRTENEVITQLYTHAINRPLFIEPGLGEQLLGAYMAGAVDYDSNRSGLRQARIGILEISGALVSRPMPGPSGAGPQSYEEIREEFDALMDDHTIDAVVLRMDSPGGFAAGLFDLTDHIFERRGEKPVHAVVDDMAFSAAYAIAAAAGKIWVSRTGGVGSVGVVSYHVDQSEYDKGVGLKITPIYAGARKVDFSPHFPLSDEAKRREQEIVDRLYEMFTDAVHRYRGMSVEDIEATEADIYHGREALDVGFADEIGTLHDALASLAAGETTTQEESDMPNETETAAAESQQAHLAEPVNTIQSAILSSGLPANLQVTLLKAGLKEDEIEARVLHAKSVADLCKTANMEAFAETFIAANMPVETVRTMLLDKKADQVPKVDVTLPAVPGAQPKETLSAQDIYAHRRAEVEKRLSAVR